MTNYLQSVLIVYCWLNCQLFADHELRNVFILVIWSQLLKSCKQLTSVVSRAVCVMLLYNICLLIYWQFVLCQNCRCCVKYCQVDKLS